MRQLIEELTNLERQIYLDVHSAKDVVYFYDRNNFTELKNENAIARLSNLGGVEALKYAINQADDDDGSDFEDGKIQVKVEAKISGTERRGTRSQRGEDFQVRPSGSTIVSDL